MLNPSTKKTDSIYKEHKVGDNMVGKDDLYCEEVFIINLYGSENERRQLKKILKKGCLVKKILNLFAKVNTRINQHE